MEERILEILEEICEDEVVYEDKDINLKEFGIEVAPTEVTYDEIDTPNKIIKYVSERVG